MVATGAVNPGGCGSGRLAGLVVPTRAADSAGMAGRKEVPCVADAYDGTLSPTSDRLTRLEALGRDDGIADGGRALEYSC